MKIPRLFTVALMFATLNSEARSLAEVLGYTSHDKILIVHADDLGSVRTSIDAFHDLSTSGLVTSGSLMLPAPAIGTALAYAHRHPEADLGVHLTLSSEWPAYRWGPVLPEWMVPSLVTEDGFLFSSMFWLFTLGGTHDLEKEMEAQIVMALSSGWRPTHLDTHMGTVFLHPSWFKAYLKLAKRYQLPPMVPRWSEELKRSFFGSFGGDVVEILESIGLFSAKGLLDDAEKLGFLPIDYLHMYASPLNEANDLETRKQTILKLLRELKPGVSQIVIHPVYAQGDFENISKTNPEQILRDHEARIFQDPEVLQAVRDLGIYLLTWREIGAAYDWANVQAP